jgi:hypothetical protein
LQTPSPSGASLCAAGSRRSSVIFLGSSESACGPVTEGLAAFAIAGIKRVLAPAGQRGAMALPRRAASGRIRAARASIACSALRWGLVTGLFKRGMVAVWPKHLCCLGSSGQLCRLGNRRTRWPFAASTWCRVSLGAISGVGRPVFVVCRAVFVVHKAAFGVDFVRE